MHGYAGNPASYPVSITLIDDADSPDAAHFDLAPQGLADRTAYLQAQSGGAFAENWMPVTTLAGAAWGPAVWDSNVFGWLLGVQNTSTFDMTISLGSGQDPPGFGTWTAIGTGVITGAATRTLRSIAADADGVHFYASFVDTSGHGFEHLVVAIGGPYQVIEQANGTFTDDQMIVFGGYLVCALGNSVAGFCTLLVNATPVPPSTSMTSIIVNTIAGAPASPTVQNWIAKSNGSYVLLCPMGAQANPFMLKSTPASNLTLVASWTAETALSSVVSGTDVITGMDWGQDGTGPCWIASVKRASTTRTIRSSDGINWTLVSTLTSVQAGGNFGAIAYAAGRWLGLIAIAGPAYGITFSLDGGLTWRPTQDILLNPGPIFPGIAGSPTQACAWDYGSVRFSSCAGLPDAFT